MKRVFFREEEFFPTLEVEEKENYVCITVSKVRPSELETEIARDKIKLIDSSKPVYYRILDKIYEVSEETEKTITLEPSSKILLKYKEVSLIKGITFIFSDGHRRYLPIQYIGELDLERSGNISIKKYNHKIKDVEHLKSASVHFSKSIEAYSKEFYNLIKAGGAIRGIIIHNDFEEEEEVFYIKESLSKSVETNSFGDLILKMGDGAFSRVDFESSQDYRKFWKRANLYELVDKIN